MTEPLSGSFHRPFDEQLAALDLRMSNLVGTATWEDLQKAQHERAFVVAGAMKADLLDDLAKAVRKAAADGTGLEDFRRQFRDTVQKHGWHGWTGEGTAKGEAWRTKVIYQTNMATSYAAGRMAQLKDGKFAFWVYKHGNAKEPRLQHLAWDAVALPPEHPFWASHAPPNGWGCTCRIRGAYSAGGVKRAGGDPDKALPAGWDAIDPKTSAQVGIDKGWNYKVGSSAADTINMVRDKIAKVSAPIGADLGASLTGIIDAAWPDWVARTLTGVERGPGLAGVMSRDVIEALDARGLRPATAEIVVDPGTLFGPKAQRHTGSGNALSPGDWATLPLGLRNPQAVLLDVKSGTLVFITGSGSKTPQLTVSVRYFMKKRDLGDRQTNGVVSAYQSLTSDLRGRVKGGELELIWGSL